MLFSLILPVYKVEKYIRRSLLSCLEQTIEPSAYEIIIVDDGSPDDSMAVARATAEPFTRHEVRYVVRENGGLSAARNTGLEHARGKYVWFIDSDDYIRNDALETLRETLQRIGEPDILSFPHTTVYEETTSTGSFDPSICNRYTDGFLFLRTTSFLSACSRIYARSFLRRHALRFREGILWEDGEFNVRALGRTKKHYCIDEALYYYIRRSGSISSSNGSNDRRSLDSYLTKIETISEWFADEPLEAVERRTVNKCISDVAIFYAALLPELPAEERRTYRKQLRERIAPNWRTLYRTGSPVQNLVGLGIRFAQPLAERLLQLRLRKALKRR